MKKEAREFLEKLAASGGTVSVTKLGPQTSQAENSARQFCKRRGFAVYYSGRWILTNVGMAALGYKDSWLFPQHPDVEEGM